MTTVGCVGGLTLDWVKRQSGVTGPTVGGNALYSAIGAWLAGARPVLCAVIGGDFPEDVIDKLGDTGIDASAVRRVEGPSFRVLLDESTSERRLSYLPSSGHNADLDPVPAQLSAWDVAHLAAIPTASQWNLATQLAASAVPFTLDTILIPGEIEPDTDQLLEVARRSVGFLPSDQEVRALWPDGDLAGRVMTLSRKLGTHVVATCAADGAIGSDGALSFAVPAVRTDVVDTTGAGDAYCGAFAAAIVDGAALERAMALASAAASVVIQGYGATHALVPEARHEVLRRADELSKVTRKEVLDVIER